MQAKRRPGGGGKFAALKLLVAHVATTGADRPTASALYEYDVRSLTYSRRC